MHERLPGGCSRPAGLPLWKKGWRGHAACAVLTVLPTAEIPASGGSLTKRSLRLQALPALLLGSGLDANALRPGNTHSVFVPHYTLGTHTQCLFLPLPHPTPPSAPPPLQAPPSSCGNCPPPLCTSAGSCSRRGWAAARPCRWPTSPSCSSSSAAAMCGARVRPRPGSDPGLVPHALVGRLPAFHLLPAGHHGQAPAVQACACLGREDALWCTCLSVRLCPPPRHSVPARSHDVQLLAGERCRAGTARPCAPARCNLRRSGHVLRAQLPQCLLV